MLRRKGVVQHVAAIMLVVISVATVASTLSSIQDHALDGTKEDLITNLQQYNSKVTIENEKQFRGLVTWNVLASQQCIYPSMIYVRGNVEGNLPSDSKIKEKFLRMELHTDEDINWSYEEDRRGKFTFYGWGSDSSDPLRAIIDETSFKGECMGADPIEATKGWGAVVDSLLPTEKLTGQAALGPMEGYSVEGRFGSVGYNMSKTVVIEQSPLFAMRIHPWWWDQGDGGWYDPGHDGPDFVRGDRIAAFIPPNNPMKFVDGGAYVYIPGYDNPKGINNYGGTHTGQYRNKKNAATSYWAFRIRMKNVPIVLNEPYFDIKSGQAIYRTGSEDRIENSFQFRRFSKQANYILCEGSEGMIKSNAGKNPFTDDVTRGDDPIMRDIVYPRVEALSGVKSCISSEVLIGFEGDGQFVPIGHKMFFGENQKLNKVGLDEYKGAQLGIGKKGNLKTKDYGKLRIGKNEGEYVKMPVKSFLVTTPGSLGYDWLKTSNMLYTREFAIDSDACPDRAHRNYDVLPMFRSDEDYSASEESDGFKFDGSSRVIYPVKRFNSEDLTAELTIKPKFDNNFGTIEVTGYSETGRELSVVASLFRTADGVELFKYRIVDRNGEVIGSGQIDVGISGSSVPEKVDITYKFEKDGQQSIKYKDSTGKTISKQIAAPDFDLEYIGVEGHGVAEIAGYDVAEGLTAPESFKIEKFDVIAPPAGCEPVEYRPGVSGP